MNEKKSVFCKELDCEIFIPINANEQEFLKEYIKKVKNSEHHLFRNIKNLGKDLINMKMQIEKPINPNKIS